MSFLSVVRRTALRGCVGARPAGRWYCEKAEEKKVEEEKVDEAKDPKDAKIEELTKSLAYSLAEADNARKIAAKDVTNAKKYALSSFAKELLDVADNLDRAASAVSEDEAQAHPTVGQLKKGVDMTNHSLHRILSNHGIDTHSIAIGDDFDPNFHDALFNVPLAEGMKPNTIANIVKKGYNYHDRVLRPSQVGVFGEA
eukprot:TRINITY_DN374_c1_g1_i1.p1 TRINITY_DN374_c1_g1~~TRINITY_DN374_c1_g1_i1.p1  ORF type:complete len:198 (+),score=80.35 TRINITY_DN374_c1_g1_i1:46-639(+)